MRYSTVAAAAALTLLSVSASLQGQTAEPAVDARSMALLAKGRAAQAAGNYDAATDALETALAIDPRNRGAFVSLGQVAQASGLPGKAIRAYREALLLDPNDEIALKGQGEAFVAKGAINRAKENLAKIRTLCGKTTSCPESTSLAAAIVKGPPVATAATDMALSKVPPKPEGKE